MPGLGSGTRAGKGSSQRVAESRVARFSRVVEARVAAPRVGATQPTLPASGTGPTAQAAEPGAGFLLPVARARRSEGRCDSRRGRAGVDKGLEIIAADSQAAVDAARASGPQAPRWADRGPTAGLLSGGEGGPVRPRRVYTQCASSCWTARTRCPKGGTPSSSSPSIFLTSESALPGLGSSPGQSGLQDPGNNTQGILQSS